MKYRFWSLLLLLAFCAPSGFAAPLFRVGEKSVQPAQQAALQQVQRRQAMAATVPADQAVEITMDDVAPEKAAVIIENETNGKSVVLSGFGSGVTSVTLTPLVIAELKAAELGEAEAYSWSLLESAQDGSENVVRSARFAVEVQDVVLPQFQFQAADTIKTTDVTDRHLVAVSLSKPSVMVLDPQDPEQQALAEAKAEEMAYYTYIYLLPDGSLGTYDEVRGPDARTNLTAGGSLVFDYTISGTTSSAQTATAYGLGLWGGQISGPVPVTASITFKDMGDSRIIGASYSPSAYSSGSVLYCSALRNQQVGYDINTGLTDIRLEFNTRMTFYFGTDPTACPGSQIDYVTVLLHEFCHGLGFFDSISSSTGGYGYGDGTMPLIFDTFLYYNGSRLTELSSSSRYSAIRSNALYWDGPNAVAANAGGRIKMFAPTTYQPGSSVSHWETNTSFSNWMEYAYQAPLHTFNSRKLGLMKDIGWTLPGGALSPPTGVAASDGTLTDKVRITWSAPVAASHYQVYRATTATGTQSAITPGWQTATSFDDTTASPGTTYYYWVKAASSSTGTNASDYSAYNTGWRAEASGGYPDQWDPGDNTATGATALTVTTSSQSHGPHGLASNDEYDCFRVSLTAGTTYTFESAGSSDTYGELYNSTTFSTSTQVASNDDSGDGTNFQVVYTPTASGIYYLRARAYTVGNSATYTLNYFSEVGQIPAPTGVTASDGTHTDKVRITWTAPGGATHYQVYRATSTAGTKTAVTSAWQAATSFDDATAAAGTTYYYWVKAASSSTGTGESNYSTSDTGYRGTASMPDLVPYKPSAWDDKLVVSTVADTNSSAATILTTDTLYLDSAVLNDGSIDIPGPVIIYDIYLDDVLVSHFNQSSDILGGYYSYHLDYNLGSLAAGTHTIKIVADPNGVVDETNEANNEYTRTITVAAPAVALSSISIAGPSTINENGTAAYSCTATYSDSTTADVTATATWSENSSYTTISGGALSATEVSSNQSVTVAASFTAGSVTKTATKTVTITNLSDPVTVSNLAFHQQPGTKLVDITYDLASTSAQTATVALAVKNGTTPLSTTSATGHVGTNVAMGTGKAIVWNMGADWNGQVSSNISVTLTATSVVTQPPAVATTAASGISVTSATLNGTVNPNGATTTARFEYGLTTAYGSVANVTLSPANGTTVQTVSSSISGLQAGQTYHYRLTATNSVGTSTGADMTLATLALPPAGMVVIPAGSNAGITVSSFYMDNSEVTKEMWDEVAAWAASNGYDISMSSVQVKSAGHPVYSVTWYECLKWCNARSQKQGLIPCYTVGGQVFKTGVSVPDISTAANGYRLPTSNEWEYAYRGGLVDKRFGWGDTISHAQANYKSSSNFFYDVSPTRGNHPNYLSGGIPYTSPAGSFAANAYGLYDMAGNLREWCWDEASDGERVVRGGDWDNDASWCQCSTFTNSFDPSLDNYMNFGFRTIRVPSSGPGSTMVTIPAGSFQMGDQSSGIFDESPAHTVNVSAFQMAKYEVTKAQWDEVRAWGLTHGYTDLAAGEGKAANHPVDYVSWYDIIKWCNARSEKEGLGPCYTVSGSTYRTGSSSPDCNWSANGYRLPTEAEWEKAARGGLVNKLFGWGATISHSQANYISSSGYSYDVSPTQGYHPTYATGLRPYTSPVGSFAANGYGLYDMAGNQDELCWDWYDIYSSGSQEDPHGPGSGLYRVIRGGRWSSNAEDCRAANRAGYNPDQSGPGFRVTRSSVP